ncbi:hypothetical protein ZIOFF_073222 [Zingiber officinale]|uniref:Uncharacterized protein n=1 Tax=Zingiber officinale TaxID=94328 RepID=A0A8J5BBQ3_ZINOF|nr:hypothetical protein ZIOFF_073222 [Zingiber officinale]
MESSETEEKRGWGFEIEEKVDKFLLHQPANLAAAVAAELVPGYGDQKDPRGVNNQYSSAETRGGSLRPGRHREFNATRASHGIGGVEAAASGGLASPYIAWEGERVFGRGARHQPSGGQVEMERRGRRMTDCGRNMAAGADLRSPHLEMVKTVVGDEAQLKAAEDRLFQSGVSAEVGLVIGNLSANSDRGFVYYLIPTPPTDGGGPACSLKREVSGNFGKDGKKGSKGAKAASEAPASLVIDADWVAEHARQVSRMLLGGMSVAGIYLWASEASFKATSPVVLAQVRYVLIWFMYSFILILFMASCGLAVKGVAQAAPFHDSEFGERLLIHVSYSPRRWSCRICTVSTGSLHPCDFKMSKLIASLQAFKCTYNFDIRLPIYQDGTSRVTEDLQLLSKSTHDVEFLVPFNKTMSSGEFSSEEMAGLVSFNGSVVAFAYLAPREPFLQAISDLKCDITSTLRSRLEMIADEAEEGALSTNGGAEKSIHQLTLDELRKPCSLTFPRRVLVPWLDGLLICDYLQASETSEDIKDHCKEMMAMEAPIEVSTVVDLETTPSDMIARSFWHVAHEHLPSPSPSPSPAVECRKQHPTKAVQTARSQTSNFYFLLAILVLVSALVVGWAIGVFGPVNTPN